MRKVKCLEIQWNDNISTNYYVDKDKYSKAHDKKDVVTLNTNSGIYSFNKDTKEVSLFDGVKTRIINVKSWKFYAE